MDMNPLWRILPSAFKPARTVTGPLGLDLATQKLHLMQMERRAGGLVFRTGISREYPCTREALLADARLFRDFLKETVASRPFAGRRVVACLPPDWIELSQIEYMLAAGQSEAQALHRELQERFKDSLQESVVDCIPVRTDAAGPGLRAALVARAPRERVGGFLDMIASSGLEPQALDIGPAALIRVLRALDPPGMRDNALLVNFGRKRTYLTAAWGRRLMLDRAVEFGEETLIGALERNLALSAADAQKLLSRHGIGAGRDAFSDTIAELLLPDFMRLAQDVSKTQIYIASRTHGSSTECIYLLGSVARYPGVAALLEPLLGTPVRGLDVLAVFTPPTGADPREFDPVAGIGVATGLALTGLIGDG